MARWGTNASPCTCNRLAEAAELMHLVQLGTHELQVTWEVRMERCAEPADAGGPMLMSGAFMRDPGSMRWDLRRC